MSGCFITVEGIEGVGKSTNLSFISGWLANHGLTLCQTREPGGTLVAEKIRALLLEAQSEPITPTAELLLMFAARAQHLDLVIKPALERGEVVLCDRFTDATYAYQGGGRGVSLAQIAWLEELVQLELRPDAVLLLDAPVMVGRERAAQRGVADRMELETLAFFERVRAAYLERARQQPERYHVIDASGSLEQVQQQLEQILRRLFNGGGV